MNTTDLKPLPARPNLEQFKKQAKDLLKLMEAGDVEVTNRVRKFHPLAQRPLLIADFALADAQLVLAREYGFESWPKFSKHILALTRDSSPTARFELAAEAVIAGNIDLLSNLLTANHELVRARSTRLHRATLLHYVSANGFESYRQKTPANAVEAAKLLLKMGAAVDAIADSYGKSTTLGLVASSIHPKRAGVQLALMDTLLEHGASIDGVVSGNQETGSPIVGALRNGHKQAAEYLARRGARLDLESAAGVGRLDVVEALFDETQIQLGFLWACQYGRINVIEFLLKKGVDINADAKTGLSGLHWSVVGGSLEAVELLLRNGADSDAVNKYGGTALGQALWCASQSDSDMDYSPIIRTLTRASRR
jgi:ankyrin repeat protein